MIFLCDLNFVAKSRRPEDCREQIAARDTKGKNRGSSDPRRARILRQLQTSQQPSDLRDARLDTFALAAHNLGETL